jgi:hypothetical protein
MMAFTRIDNIPERWTHFDFYQSFGANGAFVDSVAPGQKWRLAEVRANLSVAFVSVADLTLRISSILGNAFNIVVLSQPMLAVKELLWQPDEEIIFNSDDQLVASMAIASGTNVVGLEILGWAVLG